MRSDWYDSIIRKICVLGCDECPIGAYEDGVCMVEKLDEQLIVLERYAVEHGIVKGE